MATSAGRPCYSIWRASNAFEDDLFVLELEAVLVLGLLSGKGGEDGGQIGVIGRLGQPFVKLLGCLLRLDRDDQPLGIGQGGSGLALDQVFGDAEVLHLVNGQGRQLACLDALEVASVTILLLCKLEENLPHPRAIRQIRKIVVERRSLLFPGDGIVEDFVDIGEAHFVPLFHSVLPRVARLKLRPGGGFRKPVLVTATMTAEMQNGSILVDIARDLGENVGRLRFTPPVTHVYNPLDYAWQAHSQYLERYGDGPKEVLFLGMNPGPWGMAQTGVPFGEVGAVRDWLGIDAEIRRPKHEHPKRRIMGLACARSEVSGGRLWGWARDVFGTPKRFFERFFIANYCPLAFLEESGRNRTPDKLPAAETEPLLDVCDRALRRTVEHLQPEMVIGIGAFAEARARAALDDIEIAIGRILHPSPANPAANRGWSERATVELRELGVTLP